MGLAISYALSVTNLLSGVVTSFTETEKQMVSVERAVQYIEETPAERDWGAREVGTGMENTIGAVRGCFQTPFYLVAVFLSVLPSLPPSLPPPSLLPTGPVQE